MHLKTAGTTWLEELIGLAEAGGEGLAMAKEIYAEALDARDELCAPYAAVIDIDYAQAARPPPKSNGWTAEQYTSRAAARPGEPGFNTRTCGSCSTSATRSPRRWASEYLDDARSVPSQSISRNVTENLFDRHIKPLFLRP